MARLKNLIQKTETVENIITTTESASLPIPGCSIVSAIVTADVNTPAAKTFTADNATETFTAAAHGFTTGLKVQVSNAGGALPAGLSAATDYFVIVLTANTFRLATSLVNALAGTNLLITTDGTGTQTVTPTSIAGGSVKLQQSNDGTTWVDLGSATNVTADASFILEKADPSAAYVRAQGTLTAGRMSLSIAWLGKGVDG